MNRRLALYLTLAVAVIAIAVAIYLARTTTTVSHLATQTPPPVAKAEAGQRAPEFQVLTTHGLFDLKTANKPVFLEVFATWCPHCQRETTTLNALYDAWKNKVSFVAVSGSATGIDGQSPETPADVLAFAQRFHVKYPVAYDGTLSIANQYLQGGFPTLVIIDRQKKITYINTGEVSRDELNAAIAKAAS